MTASLSLPTVPAQKKSRKWLVVDFDGTCTERDTTCVLPKLAAKLSCNEHDHDVVLTERINMFQVHQEEYFRLYNAAKENLCNESMSLEQALDSLDDVSTLVTEQVSASGVLKGLDVSPDDILDLIESDDEVRSHVELQADCLQVLARQAANDWQLGVLSINWCPSLIHVAVVRPLSRRVDKENLSSAVTINVPIWSNAVDEHGIVSLKVRGALAKKACIQKLQPGFVVYVGDSSTDLAALIEADLGILIGNCQSAAGTAKRWGIQVLPLSEWRETTPIIEPEKDTSKVIWLAESWSEIDCVLKDVTPR
jgi:2-hydroxy-3-keto-5-methylthiopentenyl-1-phosphate phosphatase